MEDYIKDYLQTAFVFDLITSFFLMLGAYRGYKSGFLAQILGNLVLFVGLGIGFIYLETFTRWVEAHVERSGNLAPAIASVGLLLVSMLLYILINQSIGFFLRRSILGYVDSFLGLLFGLLQSLLVLLAFLFILYKIEAFARYKALLETHSLIYPWIQYAESQAGDLWAWFLKNEKISKTFDTYYQQLKSKM